MNIYEITFVWEKYNRFPKHVLCVADSKDEAIKKTMKELEKQYAMLEYGKPIFRTARFYKKGC